MAGGQYIIAQAVGGLTWSDAKVFAERLGGQLASLSTADENTAVLNALKVSKEAFFSTSSAHPGEKFGPWIGLTQPDGSSEPGGGWSWLDGSALSHTAWHPTQPDNFASDNRAQIFHYNSSYGWADHVDDPSKIGYPKSNSAVVEMSAAQIKLTGSSNSDYILGGAVDNVIAGGEGDDYLSGGGGNDQLNGGEGSDSAVFGKFKDYSFTRLDGGRWAFSRGSETDTVIGVESFMFDVEIRADGASYSALGLSSFDKAAPKVATAIRDQSITKAGAWTFTIPSDTFTGRDISKLVYSASLADGGALPSWLTFDKTARAFSGTPPQGFNGPIDLKVTAADGQYAAVDTFRLTVQSGNQAPVITSSGGGVKAAYKVAENTTAVALLTASDSDSKTLVWSITGGRDADLFTIDKEANLLSFKAAPDFEAPQDKGRKNDYDVSVTVSDGQASDSQAVVVRVIDVKGAVLKADRLGSALEGTVESDTLTGGNGADLFYGGKGGDKFYGGGGGSGGGNDLFVFRALSDSVASGRDVIYDFVRGDRFDLRALDASTKAGGNQAFAFIGTEKFSGRAGELRYDTGKGGTDIHADVDGDRKADFTVHLDDKVKLVAGDFLL